MLGENFHSAVVRMAIQIERIAMILSALRVFCTCDFHERDTLPVVSESNSDISSAEDASTIHGRLYCSDADYFTAELIGSKLILHMAAAYRLINGSTTELVPAIQTSFQKQLLFSALQPEFETRNVLAQAVAHGVPERTAYRWTGIWLRDGLITKISHGHYRKIG